MFEKIEYKLLIENYMGWPALGDVYCYVERRRSWTGFKLVRQRTRAARLAHAKPTLTAAL